MGHLVYRKREINMFEYIKIADNNKEEEKQDLIDQWKYWNTFQDQESLKSIMEGLTPTINSALQTYAGESKENPAIQMRAQLLVYQALPKYDPEYGVKLETFIFSQLQPLRREAQGMSQPLKAPQRSTTELASMKQVRSRLEEELGREPSSHELSEETGYSLKKIEQLKKIERGIEMPGTSLGEDMTAMDYYQNKAQVEEFPEWITESVYIGLSPVDQRIFDFRTGQHGEEERTNQEIAIELEISEPAVSQRVNKIHKELEELIDITGY